MSTKDEQATFPDHFSGHATDYARFRPDYPDALFAWMASLTPDPARAVGWDVGCGNGQATLRLAAHVRHVFGTDASAEQVAQAPADPRVTWRVAPAEDSGLDDASVDVVCVAQALHWFDAARFGREVQRVVRPGGALVAVTYGLFESVPAVDAAILRLYRDVVGADWPPERAIVEAKYVDVPLPGTPIKPPPFEHTAMWSLSDVIGYLGTWSATRRYMKRTGRNPIDEVRAELEAAWGDAQARQMRWPLTVVARRV